MSQLFKLNQWNFCALAQAKLIAADHYGQHLYQKIKSIKSKAKSPVIITGSESGQTPPPCFFLACIFLWILECNAFKSRGINLTINYYYFYKSYILFAGGKIFQLESIFSLLCSKPTKRSPEMNILPTAYVQQMFPFFKMKPFRERNKFVGFLTGRKLLSPHQFFYCVRDLSWWSLAQGSVLAPPCSGYCKCSLCWLS